MHDNDAIVTPVKTKNSPKVPDTVLMAATKPDIRYLCKNSGLDPSGAKEIYMSRLYLSPDGECPYAVTGPVLGAPYAAMLMETLIAWGARQIVFMGWCGAVDPGVVAGDIIIPEAACIDEGTSLHYGQSSGNCVQPSGTLMKAAVELLEAKGTKFHRGSVWSMDAIFRETPEKVDYYQRQKALAVEMEASALFSVAKFRQVQTVAVLVVSDELSTLKWRPGFRDERFKQGRKAASDKVMELCQIISR